MRGEKDVAKCVLHIILRLSYISTNQMRFVFLKTDKTITLYHHKIMVVLFLV